MNQLFRTPTATAVIIANMVGTGVFTSLGFQLLEIQSPFAILLLWLIGGVIALCGALCYAELAASLPRSGGEYHFISRIFHPSAGFVSGWISATVGFAAPSALVALTFGNYLAAIWPTLNPQMLALALLAIITVVHSLRRSSSSRFQTLFTLLKVGLIIGFCASALYLAPSLEHISFAPQTNDVQLMGTAAFAVSLIYVNYAYTGWNAVTYLSSEIEHPQRNIPLSLLLGTGTVVLLYILLNSSFLLLAPMSELAGKVEIGYIAAKAAYGENGASIMAFILALLLISTVSAMLLAGPRVLQVIGQDYPLFHRLGKTNPQDIPSTAIIVQAVVTALFIVSASFESILIFAGFTLSLNSVLTVFGLLILRRREPELERPFRMPWFPLPAIIYLALMLWSLSYIALHKTQQVYFSAILILLGFVFYYVTCLIQKRMTKS
ncbi:APC family permease [Pseudoteredinibacter isoporae]|uniref:APC family permease n=1 Tax=Pseudoteredinibacter isoporae TaxID=570281 RepID=UPI00310C1BB9